MYLIALFCVCVYISCLFVIICLSVCLCVFAWQKIDQAGGSETFLWPNVKLFYSLIGTYSLI